MVSWIFVEMDEVGSTQAVAKELASKGAREGTTVVAKAQSSGKGRLAREWVSPVGGLYMSFVLRPRKLRKPELMTLVSATAVVEGIRRATGLATAIRWPNDVVLKRRKLAGVIAEAQTEKKEIAQVIVGIGINCNASVSGLDLTSKATSLSEAMGKSVDITEIRNAVLDSFSSLYGRWQQGEDLMPIWTEHLSTPGRRIMIRLKTTENPFSCVATEVDPDGGLIVETEGETVLVRPEDLEWLREEP